MKKKGFENLIDAMPARLVPGLSAAFVKYGEELSEIRLRSGLPPSAKCGGQVMFLNHEDLSNEPDSHFEAVSKKELSDTLSRLSEYSLYSRLGEIKRGSFTVKGGHRVGICASYVGSETVDYSCVGSINIRIAREIMDSARELFDITQREKTSSLLIVSPPLCGKTTLLRDLIRISASPPFCRNITVIDERHEIAGVHMGERSFDLGLCADVLDGWGRDKGFESAVRALSPDVIACDEIGSESDAIAIKDAALSGVKVFATAHASSENELLSKTALRSLVESRCIDYVALLSDKPAMGTVVKIKEITR